MEFRGFQREIDLEIAQEALKLAIFCGFLGLKAILMLGEGSSGDVLRQ